MSKLKLYQVETILDGDDSYSIIVDYLRLVRKYGIKTVFASNDPELLKVLKCSSQAATHGKLTKLRLTGLASRTSQDDKSKSGKTAFQYKMT